MTTTSLETKAQAFLALPRIAIVGVSNDTQHRPAGARIYRRFKDLGRQVFAVNPKLEIFEGDRCFPNVSSIPVKLDGVVIITRPDITEQIVRECGEAGVRNIWMHQSSAKGTSVSPKATEYCHQHNINVIAGACPMMFGPGADFGHTCMRWFLRLTGGLPS